MSVSDGLRAVRFAEVVVILMDGENAAPQAGAQKAAATAKA